MPGNRIWLIGSCFDNVPCDGKSPFTICDYATADGTASMPHIKELIGKLRAKHGESLPIQIIYEDQPNNDYKSLVRRIHGLNSDNESSLLDETSNLFILICSTGFHRQCLPPNTVDLGFSRAAMHYMEKLPCNITGALHSSGLTVPEEIRMFKEQAAREWDHLLLARAKEMKQGGRLIIDAAAIDEHGRYLGNYECRVNLFQRLAELWKQMMDEGLITKEEFDNTNIYHYFRTKEEFIAPLVDAESGVYKAGLRLISCEMNCVMCPHRKRWMAKMKRGDADDMRKYAQVLVNSFRYCAHWVFTSGLSQQRSVSERERLADVLLQRYEDDVALAPTDHDHSYVSSLIEIQKV